MTIVEFLEARIVEDEAIAREAGAGEWESWNRSWDIDPVRDIAVDGVRVMAVPMLLDEHIATHDPARVLAECEAKRRIMEHTSSYDSPLDDEFSVWRNGREAAPSACDVILRALATVYADHPDYDEAWRL